MKFKSKESFECNSSNGYRFYLHAGMTYNMEFDKFSRLLIRILNGDLYEPYDRVISLIEPINKHNLEKEINRLIEVGTLIKIEEEEEEII